jgi:hypothetical protein
MRISKLTLGVLLPVIGVVFASLATPALADSNNGKDQKSGVIYSSLVTPLPGNLPSVGFEALAYKEFGNGVNFSNGTSRDLSKVIVTMSSWGCSSGSWIAKTCSTPEDANFMIPITLNIYGPTTDGVNPGAKITSVTQTFAIKYRPSASSSCTGPNAGKWYDKSSKTCFNGLAQNITFNFDHVKIPSGVIFGVSYNTTDYGYAPIGTGAPCFTTAAGCGYDSLNVALSEDPTNMTTGTSVTPGKLWLNSPMSSQYTDLGASGVGSFRIDSPNFPAAWGTAATNSAPWYVPAIQFITGNGGGDQQHNGDETAAKGGNENQGNPGKGIKND